MARILAIDTSTIACSVAIADQGVVHEDFRLVPQSHTQCLLPMIDQMLAARQLSLHQLDAIALTTGPGSFTGLRIGLGIVQGLAFGADLPVIGISTLMTMSCGAFRLLKIPPVTKAVPCLDARMQEVYWACYQHDESGRWVALRDDTVNAPSTVLADLKQWNGDLLAIGDGWQCFDQQRLAESFGGKVNIIPDFYPHAFDVALLAASEYAAGRVQAAHDVQPTYIRNEVSWKKRQKIRSSDALG